MFVVATSVEGGFWQDLAGIFSTRDSAQRFRDSLSEEWSYEIFSVDLPHGYPFYLTGQGAPFPAVRYAEEEELRRLVEEAPRNGTGDKILFNIYAVKGDCFNKVFPGEPLLPKLAHYHIMDKGADFDWVKTYFFGSTDEERSQRRSSAAARRDTV